jgi:hypothetical protein
LSEGQALTAAAEMSEDTRKFLIQVYGAAYGGYHRLKVGALTDWAVGSAGAGGSVDSAVGAPQ